MPVNVSGFVHVELGGEGVVRADEETAAAMRTAPRRKCFMRLFYT